MATDIREVFVAPSVLKWARETMGKSIDEVARRLGVGSDLIARWETAEESPTLGQLRQLSRIYKRPLAAFFLSTPPQEPPLPTDFRTLPAGSQKPFSGKTLLALRRARYAQALAEELTDTLGWPSSQIGHASLSDDPKILAAQTRQELGIPVETQFQWGDEATALDQWKKAVEQRGIFVFEWPFPIPEGRALSLAASKAILILLNSNDTCNGRIFSLFHEYAHLTLGLSGICDLSEQGKETERFCNRFAGEVLVPADSLLSDQRVSRNRSPQNWADKSLQELARRFRVSREVILRRLLTLGRTTTAFYEEKRRKWQSEANQLQREKQWGTNIPTSRRCLKRNGVLFTSLVLECARVDRITYRDVSDYLATPTKHLPDVEALLRKERAAYA